MTEGDDGWVSRSAKRRDVRAGMDRKKDALKHILRLPNEDLAQLTLEGEAGENLELYRRLKAGSARARLEKWLIRRMGDEDWSIVFEFLAFLQGDRDARTDAEKAVVDLRDALIGGDDEALQSIRRDHPLADHQRLRQLVMQARRSAGTPTGKGARKKLLRALRALDTQSESEL